MGVYIKDMKMPIDCEHCPFWIISCNIPSKVFAEERPFDCPLVEVDITHEKLIENKTID